MTQAVITNSGAANSYSAHGYALSAMLAATLASATPAAAQAPQQDDLRPRYYVVSYGESYQATRVFQGAETPEPAVVSAWRSLYNRLNASQESLDAEASALLHKNLWALYD